MARISIVMAVYKRPQRTRRVIQQLKSQTLQDFQAFVIGDGCPHFDGAVEAIDGDMRFIHFNTPVNHGGSGFYQFNYAIQRATAPYFTFVGNDDCLSPCHLKTYLREIEETELDFAYFDYMNGTKRVDAKLKFGYIGHCALVIRTDFLRQMPPHAPVYGHDNILIDNMLKAGAKHRKGDTLPTYYIMNYNKTRTDMEGLD
jgi:glycosyltransferase involved in cell wall biosynthesis